jgi:hypothetical protein
MECALPELTKGQNIRIQEILKESNLIDPKILSPQICAIQESKKNLVLSIFPEDQESFVIKLFTKAASFEDEKKIYTEANDYLLPKLYGSHPVKYAIPQILRIGSDYLITKFIKGENLMEITTKKVKDPWDLTFWKPFLSDVFHWIMIFSKEYKKVPLDCHIRNFLLEKETLYGVDFEELGEFDGNSILRAIATLYFSILGAYPGVIEGLELDKKAKMGIVFLRLLLLSPKFQKSSLNELVELFLNAVELEAAKVIQRRMNLERGKGYDILKIKMNLDQVFSIIQADFK